MELVPTQLTELESVSAARLMVGGGKQAQRLIETAKKNRDAFKLAIAIWT